MSNRAENAVTSTVADELYLEAIRLCPLRPIRSEAELDRAIAAIDRLIDKHTAGLRTPSEQDYMAVLAKLIEAYEEIHYPMSGGRGEIETGSPSDQTHA